MLDERGLRRPLRLSTNLRWSWDGTYDRQEYLAVQRTTVTDHGEVLVVRRCGHCQRWGEPGEDFGVRERHPDGTVIRWDGWCRPCRSVAARRYYAKIPVEKRAVAAKERRKRWRQNAALVEAKRERNREYARTRREEDAEAYKATQKRYRERLKQDPKRYAAYLEARRMAHRLRREREGLPVRPAKSKPASKGMGSLPPGPLVLVIEAYLARTPFSEDGVEMHPLERIGVNVRTFNEWRNGRRTYAQINVVDRILVALGLNWWDVYEKPVNGHSEDPEAWKTYRAACLAFEGELVE